MLPQFTLGKSGEEYIRFLLQNCGFTCELNKEHGKLIEYDMSIIMDKLSFTAEVKYDAMARKTRNLAIEYHNSRQDKPSGIYATTADVWIQIIPFPDDIVHAYAVNTKKLIKFTEDNEPHKHFVAAGDGNASLRIYKMVDILPIFSRFDNITNPSLMKSLFEGLV